MSEPLQSFGYVDPRDGAIGVEYSFKTQGEAERAAEAEGLTRFQGKTAAGKVVQFLNLGGRWDRAEVFEAGWQRHDALANAQVLAGRLARHVVVAGQRGSFDLAKMHPGVVAAYEEMGLDPVVEAGKRALREIVVRKDAYAAYAARFGEASECVAAMGDMTAQAVEAGKLAGVSLAPGVVGKWAGVDASELRVIQDAAQRTEALLAMKANALGCESYRAALIGCAPDVCAAMGAVSEVKRLPVPTRFCTGASGDSLMVECDALTALGVAEVIDVGEENIYMRKDGVHYYSKVPNTEDYAVGAWDFVAGAPVRSVAVDHAGVDVVASGEYFGKIDLVNPQYVVQSVGRGDTVTHRREALDFVPKEGAQVTVRYGADGRGAVVDRGARESVGRGR